jgi:hypothetical protein
VTGPTSKKPFSGDGIDAITRGILPVRAGRPFLYMTWCSKRPAATTGALNHAASAAGS